MQGDSIAVAVILVESWKAQVQPVDWYSLLQTSDEEEPRELRQALGDTFHNYKARVQGVSVSPIIAQT